MIKLSVIICTHNPIPDYLKRVIAAMRQQTLELGAWELYVIDNASRDAVAPLIDLSWHPHAAVVRTDIRGKTYALRQGIGMARGGLIAIVDDDNVLNRDYLERACELAEKYAMIGAFGGRIIGEFEESVPPWFEQYQDLVAIRDTSLARWSNDPNDYASMPVGAGMIVRRALAAAYYQLVDREPIRLRLGPSGDVLSRGEDIDMVLTICEAGFGKGVFPELCLTHLIPKERLQLEYLLRLRRSMAASYVLREFVRGRSREILRARYVPGVARRLVNLLRDLRADKVSRKMRRAWRAGTRAGFDALPPC